jgi:hypothetical protein
MRYSSESKQSGGFGSVPKQGYGAQHQAYRRQLAPMVEAGLVRCARCGELIEAGASWDLGHVDNSGKTAYQGAEHSRCNRGAPSKQRKAVRLRWSREW